MHAVLYSFHVKPGKEQQLITAWEELTQFIYKHENSLGSRLHKKDDTLYIAYAQWHSKAQYDNAGSNLPEFANEVRARMKDACTKIETLHQMAVVSDLLQDSPH